ncbi:glycosyltransferase [Coraliomargarita sp. SDUM461003]|uniref:Glycosyltransferase n=1 Tax=Thalassobacterium maritimum TaxID=3041265 RepID=A0ABU1AWJ9_9BACT|nr:glycosyltransferase [Coraliomargarita sp. SDUM461003]MDQ8208534.1 glycosyltransferase [Coraliomargarita sp. SDUM461003]
MADSSTALLFFTNEKNMVPFSDLGDAPTSGTVYSLVVLATALVKRGARVCIACCLPERMEADGVFYEPCDSEARLIELARAQYYDRVIVVGHAVNALSEAAQGIERCDYWLHNWTAFPDLIEQVTRFGFQQVFCVSPYHLGYYLVHSLRHPSLWRRLAYVNNPVDARFFCLRDAVESAEAEEIHVAFIGYPSRGKGFDRVVEMMEALSRLTPRPCVLHVFGDAKLYDEADDSQLDIPVYHPVVLHGSVSRKQLYPLLSSCNFAVSGLSGSETFCLSLLEAAACGVVPVTINSGGQVSFLNAKNSIIAERVLDLPARILACFEDKQTYAARSKVATSIYSDFEPTVLAEQWLRCVDGRGASGFGALKRLRVFICFVASRLRRALWMIVK